MKKKKKSSPMTIILMIILLLLAAAMIGTGVYLIFFKNQDAFERQDVEQELANQFVEDLILMEEDPSAYQELLEEREKEERRNRKDDETEEENERNWSKEYQEEDETAEEEETGEDNSYSRPYETIVDENYYTRDGVTYTPDHAKGYLDCRLEVPSAGIDRGVYGGTWEEINYNLDIWMITAARPDYVLGETHYCIYGHNHTVQDLSFNNLQKVQEDEYFYLTAKSGRYTYEITKVFAVTRGSATTDYVDNMSIGSDKCYIITCGRNDGVRNYRYLDLIVEGTLVEHLTIKEYAEQLRNADNDD